MSNGVNKLYEFEGFRFETETKILWSGDELISLPPKALDVLFLLLEAGGALVTKQELLSSVWADTFVEDGVLTQNVYILRQTLGKDSNGNQLIENIARRGYRFSAPIRIVEAVHETIGSNELSLAAGFDIKSSKIHLSPSGPSQRPETEIRKFKDVAIETEDRSPHVLNRKSENKLPGNFLLRYGLWSGAALLAGTFLIFGTYQLFNLSAGQNESNIAPIEQVRLQRLTDTGDVVFPTISPDGRMLAYVRHEENEESVWVKQIDSDSSVQILPPSRKGYGSLLFSPVGEELFYREEEKGGSIYRQKIGGTKKRVAENVWSDFTFSPDGKQIAFIRRDARQTAHLLILANSDGTGEIELSSRKSAESFTGAIGWSPDGSKIMAAVLIPRERFINLLVIDIATREETLLNKGDWRSISHILWTPDGEDLIISARKSTEPSSQIWTLSFPNGEIRRLTNDLESYFRINLSADGKSLVARQQKIIIHLWFLEGFDPMNAKQMTFGSRNFDGYSGLELTADNKVIFSSPSGSANNLYSINTNGSEKVQLTDSTNRENTYPKVTPDGRFLVFTSNRSGSNQIWRMNVDGTEPIQLTNTDDSSHQAQTAAVSPDGSEVYFIKTGNDSYSVGKTSIDGGVQTSVVDLTDAANISLLSISPDGKWLAYHRILEKPDVNEEESTMRIGLISLENNGETKQFDLPIRRPIIRWSSATTFDYSSGTFNTSAIWRQSISGEKPEKLVEFPDRIYNFAISPDGKNLAVSRGRQNGDAILISNLP